MWVHNAGNRLCEKAFSIYTRHREHLNASPETAFKNVEAVLKKHIDRNALPDDKRYIQHLGDVLDEVIKKDEFATGSEFWSPGKVNVGGRNAYSHFVDHVLKNKSGIPGGEFPDITDAVTYVKRARAFLDSGDPNVISWTLGGKRHVFHKTDNLFAVEEVSGATGGKVIKTFFHSNLKDNSGNPLSAFAWVKKRGYTGPAF